jgi:RNA polymerase sigma-70 factor (ECF subfamily)
LDKDRYFDLLKTVQKDLERYSVFLTRNRSLAQEVLSESVLAGYDGRKRLRNEDSFKAYMLTIIFRVYIRIKKRTRQMLSIDNVGNTEERIGIEKFYSNEISPELMTDLRIMYDSIDMLNAKQRQLIILSELMELPHKEISEIMNMRLSNVKVSIFRSKEKLRQLMQVKKYQKGEK